MPHAITHFLLKPIKMVITGLIICEETAPGTKMARRSLAVNSRSPTRAMFDLSRRFHLRWMINGSNMLEINLHNNFFFKKKKAEGGGLLNGR